MIRYSLCTISFRHELVSFADLVRFARTAGFDAIELWGIHALSMLRARPESIGQTVREMEEGGLTVSMISHYLDLHGEHGVRASECARLIEAARIFRTCNVRIFAGNRGSRDADERYRDVCAANLGAVADKLHEHGIRLLIETHPGTLADTLDSTLALLGNVNRPNLGVNLDVLHLWETGSGPIEAYRALRSVIGNFHFKNVSGRNRLPVFAPDNIYSPNGSREGIAELRSGAIDYASFVEAVDGDGFSSYAAIEWFGDDPFRRLTEELVWLRNRNAITERGADGC